MSNELQKKINSRVRAKGPAYVGLIVSHEIEDDQGGFHNFTIYPDAANLELGLAGMQQHYYFSPNEIRLAEHSNGYKKFNVTSFSGIMDNSKNIGEAGYSELAGGVLSFTSTMAPPRGVIDKLRDSLGELLNGHSNDQYRLVSNDFRLGPIPLKSNNAVLHSLNYSNSPKSEEGETSDNPDAWAFEIQGDGASTTDVLSETACTVMMGRRPITLLKGSAKSGTSQITLENHISFDVWLLASEIKITGEWDKCISEFSKEASGGVSWLRVNASDQINKLIESGAIQVQINFGAGLTEQRKEEIEEAADLISDKIYAMVEKKLEQAGTSMEAERAKLPKNAGQKIMFLKKNFWAGLSVAVNRKKDVFQGSFTYHKEINETVVRNTVISSQMEGVFEQASQDEAALAAYYTDVKMHEAFGKVHVIANANANWPTDSGTGDPIHSMKIQVGYPDSQGSIVWKAAGRFRDGNNDGPLSDKTAAAIWTEATKDRVFVFDFARIDTDDAVDDETIYVRKTISLKESPDVAVNEITEEYTSIDHMLEVRAESSGQLNVGPVDLSMVIPEGDKQISVLVRVKTDSFGEKSFRFNGKASDEDQNYRVWYASPDVVEPYEYKCGVTVKGKRFGQSSLNWESDWTTRTGSGPLPVTIPDAPDELQDKLATYLD